MASAGYVSFVNGGSPCTRTQSPTANIRPLPNRVLVVVGAVNESWSPSFSANPVSILSPMCTTCIAAFTAISPRSPIVEAGMKLAAVEVTPTHEYTTVNDSFAFSISSMVALVTIVTPFSVNHCVAYSLARIGKEGKMV
eukprot:CAMPEP_0178815438 /NCGR_PEP_ID=MMETSP0746-20121128/824_1 /TAXON_ID=913974 /ORGANISM="Nitzschia punctata, Strain CCMP561" /LENGTH=138 /DNA_ID=CAMNT_0020476407 /DNA_START=329 /DNA_END=741 /DNA_ORIENTATION=+